MQAIHFYLMGWVLVLLLYAGCQKNATEGRALYKKHCENCHMPNGEGLAGLIPPLAGADFLEKHRADLPCIILKGLEGQITVNQHSYDEKMPGVPQLNHIEVTNILNFVGQSWGNRQPLWKPDEVRHRLHQCSSAQQ